MAAKGMNRCIFIGNLGADPDIRSTKSGTAVMTFRIASSENRKQQDGSWGEHTEWISVVVWGKRSTGLATFLSKGHTVAVEGKMRTSSYEDRDGNKRYKTEIHADDVVVLSGRGDGAGKSRSNGNGGARPGAGSQATENDYAPPAGASRGNAYDDADYGPMDEDDIPF